MRLHKRISTLICACLLAFAMIVPAYAQNTTTEEPVPLTPDGNMTLVDDTTSTTEENKQFITVTSKNGNVFYIIIDRADEGENTVHFLNQVDESDLLSLMEEVPEEKPPICICKTACHAGDVNLNCPVCTLNYEKCMGEEIESEPVPEPKNSIPIPTIIGIIVLLGAGGGYLFYSKMNKSATASPDGEEEEDDDDDEIPTEDDVETGNIVG